MRNLIEEQGPLQRRDIVSDTQLGRHTVLEIGRQSFPWTETADFPIDDPWSVHTRNVITIARSLGGFSGDFFEAGFGDGRNAVVAGAHKGQGKIIGVDLDGWRLGVAQKNIDSLGLAQNRLDLRQGDVVSFLQDLPKGEPLTGWGVACLPQAPGIETENHADGFDPDASSLASVKDMVLGDRPVDDAGLTLNAAFLDALRKRVNTGEFNLLLTTSDRVPSSLKKELFDKTGWHTEAEYQTERPIQQDPDTGIAFVEPFDDGERFYEKNEKELYVPISAREAKARRAESLRDGGRDSLNVYHHLTVYHLTPGANMIYENR